MNEAERTELAHLKQRQARLENELKLLAQQLQTFEQRLAEPKLAETSLTVSPPESKLGSLSATPPPSIPRSIAQPQAPSIPAPPVIAPKPVVQPVFVEAQPALPRVPVAQSAASIPQQPRIAPEPKAPSTATPPPPSIQAQPTMPPRSFEMRLGTFWLVRIGIVMVLTGLVFFGNLAYQNYISKLGAGGKVFLLYLASGVLLAAGWWWQRKAVKDTLRNYAQVLFAGGLGALYFTTYAAHHLEPLRIIESALVDGVLLSGCAAFMIWAANRKQSEVLAFFAVGLGYYTSIITRVGHFTLVSNLVLSIAAVYFLVRNRWAALSFGSLAATYAAYGFWRFFDGSNWHWASPEEGLWTGTLFLMMYWAVFTSAVFLSRESRFAGQNRASFLTANNGAFFTLFILTMLQVQHGGFWKFSLIYGLVLVVLSVLAARWLKDEPLASNMYLTQGLLLVTIGLISKFAGLRLALVLGTESVLLLILGQQRKNLVLLVGAYVTAALAVGWGMDGMKQFDTADLWLGIGLGVLMMVDAFLAQRPAKPGEPSNVPLPAVLRPQTSYFVVLALVIWLVATWDNCSREVFPLVVAVEAVALSASIYALRLPEVTLFAQGFLVLADVAWVFNWMDQSPVLPWWNPLLMIGTNLAVSHWWSWQRILQPKTQNRNFWPALYALAVVGVIYLWLAPKTTTPNWIVTTSLLAIGLTAYGVITRAWFVAAAGQLFVAVSIAQFALQLWQSKPPFQFPLAPIACLFLLSFATVQWFQKRPDTDEHISEPLLQLAFVYRWVALIMSLGWIWEYVPERERIWVLALLGLSIFLWAGWRRNQEALLFSAAYTATALALFWLPLLLEASTVYVPNLLVILLLLAQRQVARRNPEHYPLSPGVHNAVIVVGTLSVWLFVSRWVLEMANGFYLTASWSVLALALFTTGLLLRERMYRWVGLGVLACALGRVIIFDVWKLETVYRILSFMALGIVLLVLGFIYSKYQEKIKEWL